MFRIRPTRPGRPGGDMAYDFINRLTEPEPETDDTYDVINKS